MQIKKTTEMKDRKVVLSTLWIFAMFNYIYADHLVIMEPEVFQDLAGHRWNPVNVTRGLCWQPQ